MKAITDKIIEALEKRAYEQFNVTVRSEIERAIEEIKEIEKDAEFEEIARAMMKHLGQGEKYNPHHTVIITNSTAELVEGVRSVGQIMDYVPD
jgi:histidinol dehydrogenase